MYYKNPTEDNERLPDRQLKLVCHFELRRRGWGLGVSKEGRLFIEDRKSRLSVSKHLPSLTEMMGYRRI